MPKIPGTDCFAYRAGRDPKAKDKKPFCVALNRLYCKNACCSFYKTSAAAAADNNKVNQRLENLGLPQRRKCVSMRTI